MRKIQFVVAAVAAVCISGSVSAASSEDQAKAAAQAMLDSFKSYDVAAIYSALPKSYQADIVSIVKTFGSKMDSEIWNSTRDLASSIISVVGSKADFVLENSSAEDVAELKSVMAAMGPVVSSLSLDALKRGDVKGILSKPEISIVARYISKKTPSSDAFKNMMDTTITKAVAGDDGIVEIFFKTGGNKETSTKFASADGAWIPAEMTDGWKDGIAEATKSLSEFKIDENTKASIMSVMPMLKMGVEQLKTATTRAEFQQKAGAIMMPIMMLSAQFQPAAGGSALPIGD